MGRRRGGKKKTRSDEEFTINQERVMDFSDAIKAHAKRVEDLRGVDDGISN